MTTQLVQMMAMLFGVVNVVFVVASALYCLARILERRDFYPTLIVAGVPLWPVGFFLVFNNAHVSFLFPLLLLVVCSGIGGWLHKASGGEAETLLQSFFLLFGVTHATVLISFLALGICDSFTSLFHGFALDDRNTFRFDMSLFFACACFTAPMAMTAFFKAFQMMKYRPGFDRHLTDVELVNK